MRVHNTTLNPPNFIPITNLLLVQKNPLIPKTILFEKDELDKYEEILIYLLLQKKNQYII